MRRWIWIVSLVGWGLCAAGGARAQEMASYYVQQPFLLAPAASFGEGLLGAANPALPRMVNNHLLVRWRTEGTDWTSIRDGGAFGTVGNLGAAVFRQTAEPLGTTGWHVSLAGGSRRLALGFGYQGFSGDATALGRYNRITTGALLRPSRYVSLGLVGNISVETDDREGVVTLGVRPLGTPRLTLFGDAAWGEGQALADMPWSVGTAVQVARGINVVGRTFEGEAFSVGLQLDVGQLGAQSQARFDAGGDYAAQLQGLRLGAYVPSALRPARGAHHLALQLNDTLPYRSTRFAQWRGDAGRFYPVIRALGQAADNPQVGAVALDMTGLRLTPEQAWEVRAALHNVQAAGKEVVVFLADAGMTGYHLASVADRVVLDPVATLTLPGYVLSRTFLAGTLHKLGLGFQAWRFFKYKSAAEILSRTGFSDADSLQRQQYVNDQYALTRREVTAARPFGPARFDRLIDEQVVFTAEQAFEEGLVDTLGRWSDRAELLQKIAPRATRALSAAQLDARATASRRWGPPPQIAIVYGIGPTEIESGIEARVLRETFQQLADDDDVKAVVFRVDSPGGSGRASDLVAEALRRCAQEKPVIVSQGQVAASGGYWISTFADTIVAGPNTVTGSIGVIGGWLYDDGFSDKTGLSFDAVQRGAHAELFSGLSLPGLSAQLPIRKLTDAEMARVRTVFLRLYDEFVGKVAAGRDTTEAHIRSIGEGRIYSGIDGQRVGLVDRIGGLATAITIAREAAGLHEEEVAVIEVNPTTGFANLAALLPFSPPGFAAPEAVAADPIVRFVRQMLAHQPQPLVVLPPGSYPAVQE